MFEHHALDYRASLPHATDELNRDLIPPRPTPPAQLRSPPPISTTAMLATGEKQLSSSSGNGPSPQGQPIEGLVHRMRRQTLRHDNDAANGRPLSALHRPAIASSIPPIPEPLVVDDAADFSSNVLEVDTDLYLDPDHDMADPTFDDIIIPAPSSFLRTRVPSVPRNPTTNSRIQSYLDSIITPYHGAADQAPPPPSPRTSTPPSASLSEFDMPLVPEVDSKLGEPDFDEGFCDDLAQDPAAWMENYIAGRPARFLNSQTPGGIRKRYPGLTYRSSQDAAMQCTNVVRNIPRMRRRKGDRKSKSSRSRATSAASSVVPRNPCVEPMPQLPLPEQLPLSTLSEFQPGIESAAPPPTDEVHSPRQPAVEALTARELPSVMEIEAEIEVEPVFLHQKMEQPTTTLESLLPPEANVGFQSIQEPAVQKPVEDHGMK